MRRHWRFHVQAYPQSSYCRYCWLRVFLKSLGDQGYLETQLRLLSDLDAPLASVLYGVLTVPQCGRGHSLGQWHDTPAYYRRCRGDTQ